ncbi:MAG: 1-(5-phosphoribosyl)-5-[(5-phosphoribosylamino)methylideneamino]imidazole-4-carboxamide isomerase [Pseudomonadota bacterium]
MEDLILFPAIDLKDGQCVRLYKGDMAQSKIFNNDPASQAREFEKNGFKWLHLVDLNGAFAGKSVNEDAISAIRSAVKMPIQMGGGIREMAHVDYWLERGINRLILGTAAVKNPDFVKEACRNYPDKIAVGIDARDGMVAVEGWSEQSTIQAKDLAQKFSDAGVAAIIYTDIHRDGALQGLNISETADFAQAIDIPVIASGGLTGYDDIRALRHIQKFGVIGAISGKALYEKKIEPAPALSLCREEAA